VVVRDPDGFFVELSQSAATPQTTAPASVNIVGSRFEIMIGDTERTVRLYKEVLGFAVQTDAAFLTLPALMSASGTHGAQIRSSTATIPGSSVAATFTEFKGIERQPLRTRFQDPGTPVLQLRVRDIDTVTRAWRAAGGEVISTDGQPVDLGTIRIIVFRDPNNLMLEMIEARPSGPGSRP